MYCPKCRTEYREGFTQCSDCGVTLANELPLDSSPEYEELVTVYEGDSNSAVVARSAVENAGIDAWAKDEEIHGLFPSLGAVEILVCAKDKMNALNAIEIQEQPDLSDSTVSAKMVGSQNQ